MTVLSSMYDSFLGFAMILFCAGLGLLSFVKNTNKSSAMILFTSSLFLNSLGFFLWAGTITSMPKYFFIAGELTHFMGFIMLCLGVQIFSGFSTTSRFWRVIALLIVIWLFAAYCMDSHKILRFMVLVGIRALIFIWSGITILRSSHIPNISGKIMAGSSLVVWGVYVLFFRVLWTNPSLIPMGFGLLIGFHIIFILGIIQIVLYKKYDHIVI